VIECVQGVIEAMTTSSASGCALALVDQQLVDRAEWIYGWMGRSIVDEAFEQVLRDYPDLHDAVEALVSVLCQSFMSLTMVISLDIVSMHHPISQTSWTKYNELVICIRIMLSDSNRHKN